MNKILLLLYIFLFSIISCSDTSTNPSLTKKFNFITNNIWTKYIYDYTNVTINVFKGLDTSAIVSKKRLFSSINNKWLEGYIISDPVDFFNVYYELDSILYKGWITNDTIIKEVIKINLYDLTKSTTDYTSYKKIEYYKGQKPFLKSIMKDFPTAFYFEELINNKYYTTVYADSIGIIYYQELNYSTGAVIKECILREVINP